MATKRVQFKLLQGNLIPNKHNALCETFFNKGVKFSKLIETKDAYIAVCFQEEDVGPR